MKEDVLRLASIGGPDFFVRRPVMMGVGGVVGGRDQFLEGQMNCLGCVVVFCGVVVDHDLHNFGWVVAVGGVASVAGSCCVVGVIVVGCVNTAVVVAAAAAAGGGGVGGVGVVVARAGILLVGVEAAGVAGVVGVVGAVGAVATTTFRIIGIFHY